MAKSYHVYGIGAALVDTEINVTDDDLNTISIDFQTAGVDYHINKCQDEGITGTCLVVITPDAERTLCTFLGINAIQSHDDIISEVIAASNYVYFEAYMIMSLPTFIAAKHLCEIIYRDRLCEILEKPIDLLFCNRNEAFSWSQTDQIDSAIEKLKLIAHTFVITLGAEGSLVYNGRKLYNITPHKVHAGDSSTAGDMFAGAFLFGITHGQDYFTAGNFASVAAATVVSNNGSRLSAEKQKQLL
ncbi:unnamed protein product [Adineta ricciae]|uniref:Carbohydrate kinase PfkB domain-containing protein n=1 Tax=Adineta ricciae TaxID=249248 RepID=A0A816G4N5_ADIRI|nr:unnamed protein product [Adineta ricciae]CAF1669235.1 unnamed protein product [Adineta ricciae]